MQNLKEFGKESSWRGLNGIVICLTGLIKTTKQVGQYISGLCRYLPRGPPSLKSTSLRPGHTFR
jgi:hypothetical protein